MKMRTLGAGLCLALGAVGPAWAAPADDPPGYWEVQGNARLPFIQERIEEEGLCWTAGETSVSGLTDDEKRQLLGYVRAPVDRNVPDPFPPAFETRDLPSVFDWRDTYRVTAVRNQGNCGSCWLFGPVAAFESALRIYEDQEVNLSEQQILSCVSGGWGCNGGWPEYAYDHYVSYGAIEDACMPYRASHGVPCTEDGCGLVTVLDGYYSVNRTVNAIKNAVYTYGPVSTGIYVYDDFFSYREGCYQNTDTYDLNHIVTIVGWDDTQCNSQGAWIIKNSWGVGWGMGGFAYVKYNSTAVGYETHRLAYTPKMHLLRLSSCSVLDGGRGNGNGALDPGETAVLAVTLLNDGNGTGAAVTGVLRTSRPGVTVIDSTAAFPDVPSHGTAVSLSPHFEVSVDETLSPGDWIEFDLALSTSLRPIVLAVAVTLGTSQVVLADDFETDLGWVVGAPGDDATEGIWERVDSNEKRDPWYDKLVQPDRDDTPFPGTMCYVTENSPLGTKMRIGDVDGGRTTLLSPLLDLSGFSGATLSYARWYSNDAMPSQVDGDPFEVDVSSDGGATWASVESLTETPQDRAWHRRTVDLDAVTALTDRVRVRFVAQDIGVYNSVVEAAVDDIEVRGFGSVTPAAERQATLPGGPTRLALGQNLPNPFSPETTLPFVLPRGARADLGVYNVQGQRVRRLVGEWLPAGSHSAVWDGRDEAGLEVSAGVYFCRLESGGESQVRRLTLLR